MPIGLEMAPIGVEDAVGDEHPGCWSNRQGRDYPMIGVEKGGGEGSGGRRAGRMGVVVEGRGWGEALGKGEKTEL